MTSTATHHDLCVLLTPREVGGHEGALAGWLADAVRRHGLRPRVVAPGSALHQCFARAGLHPHLPAQRMAGWTAVAQALADGAQRGPLLLAPGSVHAHPALLAAALASRRPVSVYVPNTHSARTMGARLGGPRDALLAPLLRRVAHWIVLTDAQARHLREAWQCRHAAIEVLPNLARLDGPGPQPPPAPDGRLRVAFVGRLDLHSKGLDWLCDTLLARPDWARSHHWRFQGEGPGRARLQQLADRLGPACVALVPHGPIDAAFAACDLLLLASRFEGQPLVALEALQRGWPVVASVQSGLSSILPAEAQFPFGDAAALARALQHMASAGRRQASVAHARQRHDAARVKLRYDQALARLSAAWQSRSAVPAPCAAGA